MVSKAGLLTPPPDHPPSHPIVSTTLEQWHSRRQVAACLYAQADGVTAAGPFPIPTGFPFKPYRRLLCALIKQEKTRCQAPFRNPYYPLP
jgi:hypothetical protein